MKNKKLIYSLLSGVIGFGALGINMVSAHGFGGFGMGMFGATTLTPDQIATRQQTMFQNQATILGISVDDVKSEWAQGKTLSQIIADKGIDKTQLMARIQAGHLSQIKTTLQALVDKGIITQAQADQRLQFMQTRFQNQKGRGHHGFGLGFFGGFGRGAGKK